MTASHEPNSEIVCTTERGVSTPVYGEPRCETAIVGAEDLAAASGSGRKELSAIYSLRFAGLADYRRRIWQALVQDFFGRWFRAGDSVLDLGCGQGEFINAVPVTRRLAMDLNPNSRQFLAAGVQFLEQDCSDRWPLQGQTLDLVFTSNFFEHLPTRHAIRATLREAYRCLKPGGHLLAMGPNIKASNGRYWDFFDHYIPLTEVSLMEAMRLEGFEIELVKRRFLPYTMSLGFTPPVWALRLYLKLPIFWPVLGSQFLVVAKRPGERKGFGSPTIAASARPECATHSGS